MNRKFDTYQDVTDAVIAQLEAGVKPWMREWSGAPAAMPLRSTGQPYRGINVLLLWMAATTRGYAGQHWLTFKQAQELGAQVRKGEKASRIVFFKRLELDAGEGEESRSIPMLRTYCVFNSDQVDGLPDRLATALPVAVNPALRDQAAETALHSCGATIREGGTRAFYDPRADIVTVPDFERFNGTPAYLATLAHELCHWTGHCSRLDRVGAASKSREGYGFEELIAELGAAFVGSRLGFVGEHFESHAAYLGGWLGILRADKRAIFRAASAAQAAADLVLANADATAPVEELEAA